MFLWTVPQEVGKGDLKQKMKVPQEVSVWLHLWKADFRQMTGTSLHRWLQWRGQSLQYAFFSFLHITLHYIASYILFIFVNIPFKCSCSLLVTQQVKLISQYTSAQWMIKLGISNAWCLAWDEVVSSILFRISLCEDRIKMISRQPSSSTPMTQISSFEDNKHVVFKRLGKENFWMLETVWGKLIVDGLRVF